MVGLSIGCWNNGHFILVSQKTTNRGDPQLFRLYPADRCAHYLLINGFSQRLGNHGDAVREHYNLCRPHEALHENGKKRLG